MFDLFDVLAGIQGSDFYEYRIKFTCKWESSKRRNYQIKSQQNQVALHL